MSETTGREALAKAYFEPLGWDLDDLDPDDLRECLNSMTPVLAHIAAVLSDAATVEAVMATYPAQLGRSQRARWALAVVAERFGIEAEG